MVATVVTVAIPDVTFRVSGNSRCYIPDMAIPDVTIRVSGNSRCYIPDMAILDVTLWQFLSVIVTRPIWPARLEPRASPWKTI